MRKSFLKTIVATAVVGATMALTSVAAWAETYYAEYKLYNNGDTSLNTTMDEKFGFDVTPNQLTSKQSISGKVVSTVFNDSYVTIGDGTNKINVADLPDYYSATSPTYGKQKYVVVTPTTTGTLNLYMLNIGQDGVKSESFKAYEYKINGEGAGYCGDSLIVSDVQGRTSGANGVDPISISITQGEPIALYFGNSKTVLFAANIVASGEEEETLTAGVYDNNAKTGKIVVTADAAAAPSVYVVATLTEGDLALGNTLIVSFNDNNKTTVETDTVYEAVDGIDTANFGGDYYYAVKIDGVSKDADVEQLKAFTFDIVTDIA